MKQSRKMKRGETKETNSLKMDQKERKEGGTRETNGEKVGQGRRMKI